METGDIILELAHFNGYTPVVGTCLPQKLPFWLLKYRLFTIYKTHQDGEPGN